MINRIRTSPDKRKAIISDLYLLHCEGMHIQFFIFCFNLFFDQLQCNPEIVLGKNEEILDIMIECGILETLVDIFSGAEYDSETLV